MIVQIINKFCPCCKNTFPTTSFYSNRSKPDGFTNICKECTKISNKKSASRPEAKIAMRVYCREYARKHKQKNVLTYAQRLAYNLHHKYGITIEIYNELFAKQDGLCGICQKASNKKLSVDHCHKTGKVRGLLCNKCNVSLGTFGDSIEGLMKAIEYLKANI